MQVAHKTFRHRFFILLSLIMVSLQVTAQVNLKDNDPVYGYDPLLFNGKVYIFHSVPGTEGTQYLYETFDSLGSITVRGVTFANLTVNYDIYNQLLVLKYENVVGAKSFVAISYGWLEKASIWGRNFETFMKPDSSKRLYQVLGNGNEKILYYLSKELLLDNLKNSKNHYFSSVKKEMFISTNGQLISFKSNAGFIKSFSLEKQSYIKAYLRIRNIKVKKANDLLLTDLIDYCNNIQGS